MAGSNGQSRISVIISAVTSGVQSAVNRVTSALSGMGSRISSLGSSISGAFRSLPPQIMAVGGAITAIGTALTAAGAAVGAFAVKALQASANMETLKKGLEFNISKQLGGDVNAAKEQVNMLISEMQMLGEQSAYDSNQLIPLARSWVNIGDSAETAALKMRTIVDTASAFGATEEQMQRINLALTQMQMKGKIQAEEMMQLTEANIPGWTILSEAMGKSTQELQDMASKGQLTGEAMVALFNGMQEKYGGMAKGMSDGMAAKFASIREAATNTLSNIGDIIRDGLDVPGVLDKAGEIVEGMRDHIDNIQTQAEKVGIGQAIVDELNSIAPGFGDLVGHMFDGLAGIKDTIMEHLVPALEHLGLACAEQGDYTGTVFEGICEAIEIVIIVLSEIIEVLALIKKAAAAVENAFLWCCGEISKAWDAVCNFIAQLIADICAYMTETFGGAFTWIANAFSKLADLVSKPIDLIVNVIWHDTKTGESTEGNKKTEPSSSPSRNFNIEDFGDMSIPSGGSFGGGGGGRSSRSGGGGRGSQKETWEGRKDFIEEVGKSVDEAVNEAVDRANKAAAKAKDSILKSFKSDALDDALKRSYQEGRANKTQGDEIRESLSKIGKKESEDPYSKIWDDAKQKIKSVGENLRKLDEYQKSANEKAAEYSETGEKTRQHEAQREAALKRIADLQEKIVLGKADDDTAVKIEREKADLIAKEIKFKQEAAKAAEEAANANKASIAAEIEGQKAIETVKTQALEKIHSRETALQAANLAQQKANNATNLNDFINMMNEKDAYTRQSYASILAQEELLNEQRQVWHEQLMLNAMEWSEYMQMTFTTLNQQLVEGLSGGLAECIAQGKSLIDMFENLAMNLLQNLINNALKKWLTSLIGIGAQQKENAAAETAGAMQTAAAESAKTGAIATNAIGSYITAKPWMAETAGPLILQQMGMGRVFFADGGLITGAGTSTSDSIPAMLSNGEFVMRAEAVERLGTPFLYALNEGKTFHYSSGGQVGKGSAGEVLGGNVTLNVSAIDSESFETFLLRGGLDTIRQALYDNNRNFGSSAGVF